MSTLAAPLVRYGFTAGAEGAGAIHPVGPGEAYEQATGERSAPVTIDAALSALRSAGARIVVAELPDVPAQASLITTLVAAGFIEAGRVRDFVDEGVDLLLLTRRAWS